MKDVLSRFDLLLMRTPADAERIVQLGADPTMVRVAGNTKYDILPKQASVDARRGIRDTLGIGTDRKVIALGSAREGECEIVFRALSAAEVKPFPLLVVAPRHLGLVPQIEQVCRDFGYRYSTLSDLRPERHRPDSESQVMIIAEMGRLLEVYAISDIAIVGGTYRPFGGHNPLEPASQGAVTIVGPYIQNIQDDIDYLHSRDCAFIADEAHLGDLLKHILSDGRKRKEMGERAVRAVEDKKGIAQRCVEVMAERNLLP